MFDFRNTPSMRVFKVLGCGIVIIKTDKAVARVIEHNMPIHQIGKVRFGISIFGKAV